VRVLLISMPDTMYLFRWGQVRLPNLAISSLAGNVGGPGREVKLLDLVLRPHGVRRMVKEAIQDFRPDVLGLSAMSFQFRTAGRIARLARSLDPSLRIVLGGYHATLAADEIVREGRDGPFDFVVRGEGEATLRELLDAIEGGGESHERVTGLSYRRDGEFVHNPARPLMDVSQIALPDRAARLFRHREGFNGFIDSIETSRGCLMMCSFCSIRHMYGPSFRCFPIDRVLEDIRRARALGARRVFFSDDNITLDVERFKQLCRAIADTGLNDIRYSTQASSVGIADNPELVALMRDANFTLVFVGIEGLNERNLRFMRKGRILDHSIRAVDLLLSHGIQVAGGFISGLPDDRPEDVRKVFRFVREHKIAVPIVWCSTPYPKTEFREDLLKAGMVVNSDNYYRYNGWCTNVRTRHMTRWRLSVERSLGYLAFLLRAAVLGDNYYVRKLMREQPLTTIYYRITSVYPFLLGITGTWQSIHSTTFYGWRDWPLAVVDAFRQWRARRRSAIAPQGAPESLWTRAPCPPTPGPASRVAGQTGGGGGE